jgi:dTDP-glucose 4,6-dehydratase
MTTILLTGAAGFIGSHLARYLLEHTDWSVVSLDRLDEAGNQQRLAKLVEQHPTRLSVVWHDLKAPIQPERLRRFGDFRYVAHLAAGSHVDRSVRDPVGFVMDNVLGTAHLLEYVRQHQPHCEKALYFSTDEVFGPAPEGVIFDEHAPWNPENPYAASKAGAEALCPAWAAQYGLPIVITHCSNAYGPGQDGEKFIPLCAGKVARGELVQIHARGGKVSSRLYIHVDDVSSAVLTILQKGGILHDAHSGKYNIVAAEELSNLLVAQQIADVLGRPLRHELVENPPNRPKPDMRYALSGAKLEALGWAPRVPFELGLRDALHVEPIGHHPV